MSDIVNVGGSSVDPASTSESLEEFFTSLGIDDSLRRFRIIEVFRDDILLVREFLSPNLEYFIDLNHVSSSPESLAVHVWRDESSDMQQSYIANVHDASGWVEELSNDAFIVALEEIGQEGCGRVTTWERVRDGTQSTIGEDGVEGIVGLLFVVVLPCCSFSFDFGSGVYKRNQQEWNMGDF